MQCKRAGIKRVSFTGGEPFLHPEFLNRISALAVREGMLFGRIMTNGVWYKSAGSLEAVLTKLFKAGYDGDICVSADAFHSQDIRKVTSFIKRAAFIWGRPDIVSIAWVGGSREKETKVKLKRLLSGLKGLSVKTFRIDLSPIGGAGELCDPWGDDKWFKEDRCKGPGNALFVLPDGQVKPCCGYATDHAGLTIGNINKDSAAKIILAAGRNDFVRSVFTTGLGGIRRRLEKLGIRFPGKTENHCFFCHYILTKAPKGLLKRALCSAILLIALIFHGEADAAELKKANGYKGVPIKVVRKIQIPKWYHEGLFIDEGSIWVANGRKGNIWVVDIESAKITADIESPAGFTEAIIKADGGKYLVTDWEDKKLYEVVFDGQKAASKKSIIDFTPSHPAGLVSIGDRIFVILWTRGLGTKFEIAEFDKNFKETARISIRDIQEPAHMAWDGKSLWITGWYNRRIYRVDPENWEIMGSIRAPFNKVTGIAWDGKYLWVTGTYADLYQIELSEFPKPGVRHK